MRISEASIVALLIGAGLIGAGLAPAFAFDGTHGVRGGGPGPMLMLDGPPRGTMMPPPPPTMDGDEGPPPIPRGAMPVAPPPGVVLDRSRPVPPVASRQEMAGSVGCGTGSVRADEKPKTLSSLQYAAEQGHPAAQWQLGNMFARGEGVPRDDVKAFEYFSRIADDHADEPPTSPQARIAASAFVALGCYYLDGIPNSHVRPDPEEARNRFFYAASYFGDAEAQYHLARMMLDGLGGARAPQQAIKWLGLSAAKGNSSAQAVLGRILFEGSLVRRQGARGLMWLSLARDGASPEETWIVDLWDSALKQANDDERAMAAKYIEEWMRARRRGG
jgi:TPR repeat protein